MRHGQGAHNVFIESHKARGVEHGIKINEVCPSNRHLVDPRLTDLGEAEARAARAVCGALEPDLIVVSPMRRATRTAEIAFDGRWKGTKKVAHELCR